MTKLIAWISAFRLRTLPLAVAGIILGSFLAVSDLKYNWSIILLALLTAVLLQILSNLANDYGDFSKGTDNEHRVGPTRALQSGEINQSEMKSALIITSVITLTSGILLLWVSFGTDKLLYAIVFFSIGILAIWAAIKYTVGKSAYGYQGFGDLFVFLFFGWVSVVGIYFLQVQSIEFKIFLPGTAMGFLSAGVLNLNNLRDIVNDKASDKITLAVKLGAHNARIYQLVLLGGAFISSICFTHFFGHGMWQYMYFLSFVPLGFVAVKSFTTPNLKDLDPLLKVQALSTLLYALTFGLGQAL